MPDPKAARGPAPSRRTKVFISYRRDGNAGDAERLYDELKRYIPVRHLFLDVKSIRTGDSFPLAIESALASGGSLLAVIGPRWLGATDEQGRRRLEDPSDMVRREISAALARGIWVIPVLMHGAAMPEAKDLPDDMKRLAECQAVEIRSGHWERDVRELVALLKRRLYRRKRLATALSFLAVLAVIAALSYYLLNLPRPVHLSPDGEVTILPVAYHPERVNAQPTEGEAVPQELVIEGLDTAEEIFRFNGEPVAFIRVDFDLARFQDDTINKFELKTDWGTKWEDAVYSTGGDDPEAKLDYEHPCPTSAVVVAADSSRPPTSLRLFQQDEPLPETYRSITLSADRELAVNLDLKTGMRPATNGAGCLKQLKFGEETKPYGWYSVGYLAGANAPFDLQFFSMDQKRTSPRNGLLRLGAHDHLDIQLKPLRARRVVIRARAREEIPCGDKLRQSTVSFEAKSADDKSWLYLQQLEIGANQFLLTANGDAYVNNACQPVRPGIVERMWTHLHLTVPLLASACFALIGLVYSVAKL